MHTGALIFTLTSHWSSSEQSVVGLPCDVSRFVKLWSLTALSEADSGEDSQYFFLQPLEQLHLGLGVRIRGLLWQSQERWLVSDEGGSLIQASVILASG